jgi:hypothetical protein
MDKNINTRCICENDLNNLMDTIIVLYPCCHLYHTNCLHNSPNCYICNGKIDYVIPESQIEELKFINKEYYQIWIDLLSIKITSNNISILLFKFMQIIFLFYFNMVLLVYFNFQFNLK